MQHRSFLYRIPVVAGLLSLFLLASCREDAIIKSSLTPAVDNIHTFGIGPDFNNGTDTITIQTRTVYEDSIVTSSRLTGFPIFHALGWMTDPYAGKTAASIFMQVAQPSTTFKLDANDVIDSVVLVLPYAGFTWGDTTVSSSHSVKIYQITDPFSKDTSYYNFSSLSYNASAVGAATFKTGPVGMGVIQDSVSVRTGRKAPHLRVTLSSFYKDALVAAIPFDTSFAEFSKKLPGLAIVADSTGFGSAFPYFRLNGTVSAYGQAGVLVYAHNTGTGNDSIVYQFPYNEAYSAHFNRITRNYTGTAVAGLLGSTDPNAATVAMQNAPGVAIDVVLPHIQHLPKNVIINKAELVFTKVSAQDDAKFFGPARLYPTGINSSGGRYTIADRYAGSSLPLELLDFIDGTPRSVANGTETQYRINIPREIQKTIAQGIDGLHLRIGGTVNFPAAYRLVLGGSGNAEAKYRPTINIIYTKQ